MTAQLLDQPTTDEWQDVFAGFLASEHDEGAQSGQDQAPTGDVRTSCAE